MVGLPFFGTVPFFAQPQIVADNSTPFPEGYPTNIWNQQSRLYNTLSEYYSGDILDEPVDPKSEDAGLKYPVGLNLVRSINHLASYAVMGEWTDRLLDWEGIAFSSEWDQSKDAGYRFLNAVAHFSGFSSLYLRQILSQSIFGGMVWGIRYRPDLATRVRWIGIPVGAFYPVFSSLDQTLMEAFVTFPMPSMEAKRLYGVQPNQPSVLYQEHWLPDQYEISIDGSVVSSGVPPGRIVPFVYVPRLAPLDTDYGEPVAVDVLRIQNEINARMGDVGDAVNQETHRDVYVSNIPGGARAIRRHGRFVDLGLGWGNMEPSVHDVDRGKVPAGAMDLNAALLDFLRYTAHTPSIAFGEDEGSQRSALTLTTRMWPLVQAAKTTRGIIQERFTDLFARSMGIARMNGVDIAKSADFYQPVFPPMLPKDREQIVMEVVQLSAAQLISPERALALLDVPEGERASELQRIEAIRQQERELQKSITLSRSAGRPGAGRPGGSRFSSSSNGNKAAASAKK